MARRGTVEFDDRVEMLRRGETQWGCDGQHSGNGSLDCPLVMHHHHDIRCAYPTYEECDEAGVRYRMFWDSRAGGMVWANDRPITLHWTATSSGQTFTVPASAFRWTRLDANGGIA